MKIIRQITYESHDQGDLDRQLGRSLPDGIRPFGINCVGCITVRTVFDERVQVIHPDIKEELPSER